MQQQTIHDFVSTIESCFKNKINGHVFYVFIETQNIVCMWSALENGVFIRPTSRGTRLPEWHTSGQFFYIF